jgi:hypothetical protein
MSAPVMMPEGIYYVGDLCYVMENWWDEVFEKTIQGDEVLNGRFVLDDGTEFAMLSTFYGDGSYTSNVLGGVFPVDSGSIGVVKLSAIGKTPEDIVEEGLGKVITFDQPFEVKDDKGTLMFGNLIIFTNDEEGGECCEPEYYEDEDDDDFDYSWERGM